MREVIEAAKREYAAAADAYNAAWRRLPPYADPADIAEEHAAWLRAAGTLARLRHEERILARVLAGPPEATHLVKAVLQGDRFIATEASVPIPGKAAQ